MTTTITRRRIRVPADTDGQQQRLEDIGFQFDNSGGDDAIYRTALLPRGWRARGLHPLQPVDIVDTHTRIRVLITYGARPALNRDGSSRLDAAARMRLVPLREYLIRALANNEPIIPDSKWATPERIHRIATAEAGRAEERWAYFARVDQGAHAARQQAKSQAWDRLANQFAPTLESAA